MTSSQERTGADAGVRDLYSTWSRRYYEDYYGPDAAYPPVHRDLLIGVLRDSGARTVLDAGCGPASFLRHAAEKGFDVYGFDLVPEMVEEARRVLAEYGVPADHVWQGSVLSEDAFRRRDQKGGGVDAAVCVGVLPHIPDGSEDDVIRSLRSAVLPGGLVALEGRNQLFALFTLNRYTYEFFRDELVRPDRISSADASAAVSGALDDLRERFRMDLPPVRRGRAGEPGYDEVLSRTHNPLLLREQFASHGFEDVRLLFYHYHALPPMLEPAMPELFRDLSLSMEEPGDWRGHFMASAFILVGRRA